MAQDFDKPIPADLEIATRLQNERDMNVALAKGSTSSALGKPIGALDFSAPGSYDRILSQYNGTVYTGFNLKVDKLTVVNGVNLGFSGAFITATASDTLFSGNTSSSIGYNNTSNQWSVSIANFLRAYVAPTSAGFLSSALGSAAGSSSTILNFENNNGNASPLLLTSERLAAGTDWVTASTRLQKKVDATFMSFIDFGFDGAGGIRMGAGQSATAQQVPSVLKIGGTGRTVIGASVLDDLITTLQTGTLKATEIAATLQPYAVIACGSASTSSNLQLAYNMQGFNTVVSNCFTVSDVLDRVTVARKGVFLFSGIYEIFVNYPPAAASIEAYLYLYKNGVAWTTLALLNSDQKPFTFRGTFSACVDANINDYFELYVTHPPGSAAIGISSFPIIITKLS